MGQESSSCTRDDASRTVLRNRYCERIYRLHTLCDVPVWVDRNLLSATVSRRRNDAPPAPANGSSESDDTPPDGTTADDTPPDDHIPPDDTTADGTPPDDTTADDTPPDDIPPDDTPPDDTITADAVATLTHDLTLLRARVGEAAWTALLKRNFALWVNASFAYYDDDGRRVDGQGSCFHLSRDWLREHGNLARKQGSIEIYVWQHYLSWDLNRAAQLMHELAHCYHYSVLSPRGSFEHADIGRVFERAVASGKYEKVPRQNFYGEKDWDAEREVVALQRAYALTDCSEFFASLSVPFFGFVNDWYPFERRDLEEFDAESVALLGRVWGVSGATAARATAEGGGDCNEGEGAGGRVLEEDERRMSAKG